MGECTDHSVGRVQVQLEFDHLEGSSCALGRAAGGQGGPEGVWPASLLPTQPVGGRGPWSFFDRDLPLNRPSPAHQISPFGSYQLPLLLPMTLCLGWLSWAFTPHHAFALYYPPAYHF